MRARVFSLAALLLSASACGRFGFGVGKDAQGDPRAQRDPDASTAALLDAAVDPTSDGGLTAVDDSGALSTARDASVDENLVSADGSTTSPDAGAPTTSLDCSQVQSALICQTFESGSIPPGLLVDTNNGCSISVMDGALVASIDDAGDRAILGFSMAAITSGSVFVRLELQVPSGLAIDELNFLALAPVGAGRDIDFNLISGDRLEASFNEPSEQHTGPFAIARDRFVCMYVRVDVDGSAGGVLVRADNTTIVSASGFDTLPGQGITAMRVGVDYSGANQAPAVLKLRNIVLATSDPGPCP